METVRYNQDATSVVVIDSGILLQYIWTDGINRRDDIFDNKIKGLQKKTISMIFYFTNILEYEPCEYAA